MASFLKEFFFVKQSDVNESTEKIACESDMDELISLGDDSSISCDSNDDNDDCNNSTKSDGDKVIDNDGTSFISTVVPNFLNYITSNSIKNLRK